jgi:hypothetical protein
VPGVAIDLANGRASFLLCQLFPVFFILFPEIRKIRNGASLLQDKKNNR